MPRFNKYNIFQILLILLTVPRGSHTLGNGSNVKLIHELISTQNATTVVLLYHSDVENNTNMADVLEGLNHMEITKIICDLKVIDLNQFNLELFLGEQAFIIMYLRSFDLNDHYLRKITKLLRGCRQLSTIFMATHLTTNLTNTTRWEFFRFLWLKQFTHPLLITSKDYFTLDPYPTLKVRNVTNHLAGEIFPPKVDHDFKGYHLKVPIQLDIPRTFWYQKKNGQWILDGYGGSLFTHFCHYYNLTFSPMKMHTIAMNMDTIIRLIRSEKTEMSPHFDLTHNTSIGVGSTYPYTRSSQCLMIPLENQKVPRSHYLMRPFRTEVWLLIGAVLVVVTIGLTLMKYLIAASHDIGNNASAVKSFICALSMIVSIPLPLRGSYFRRLTSSMPLMARFFFFCLMIYGFILSQIYITTLESFLATTLFNKPKASMATLIAENRTILSIAYKMELIRASGEYPEEFYKLFKVVEPDEFSYNRDTFNTDYIYPISRDRWSFLSALQRYRNRKLFWYSDICFGVYPIQFHIQYDSHLYEPMYRFVTEAVETGVIYPWIRKSYRRAISMSPFNFEMDMSNGYTPYTLEMLSMVFNCMIAGYILSLLVFLGEILYKKMQKK